MKKVFLIAVAPLLLCGCVQQGFRSAELFTLPSNYLAQRQIEQRTYNTDNEALILRSAVEVLQDMGYTFRESNSRFGVLTGTAIRPADNATAKAAAAMLITFLGALGGSQQPVYYEYQQTIEATVVTKKTREGMQVRTTFARRIFLTNGSSYVQRIIDPEIYRGFFSRLDQSVFLTSNAI